MGPIPRDNAGAPDYLADRARLDALRRLGILDSEPEGAFDAITRLGASLFDVPIVTIHLLDNERQWVKASTDPAHAESSPARETVCQYTIAQSSVFVVPDLSNDRRFRDAQYVTGERGFRFYAGAPLRTRDGQNVGTLCLLDRKPRPMLDESEIRMLEDLAAVVIEAMELRAAHQRTQHNLLRAVEEDALTGLMSRRGVLLHLQRLSADHGEKPAAIAMVQLRIARIEQIRAGYGSALSNQLLKDVAERLRGLSDTGDVLARLDGTAFLFARTVPGAGKGPASPGLDRWAQERAQAALASLHAPFTVDDEAYHLEGSAGIARFPEDSVDAYQLLDVADNAALKAEETRGDSLRLVWGDSETGQFHRRRLTLEQRLRRALAKREFELAYQPIVDLQNGNRIVGAEALLRWPQPSGPPIGPDLFIPLAEEIDLIQPLGLWAFEEACETLRSWQQQGRDDLWMSVNLSPRQLTCAGLANQLSGAAERARVDPSRIKLEITESALIEHFDEVAGVLDALTDAGFPLALDDFGTGHSSLSRLIHLPFSVLKVDRVFVADTPNGPGAAVVASLSQLARTLRLEALGEGIETAEHEQYLRSRGYQLGQGFRFARPASAEDLLAS